MNLSILLRSLSSLPTLTLVALTLGLGSVAAQSAGNGREGRPHNGPPPAAFQACASAEVGDACSFEGREGDLQGTCQTPRGERLVCVPAGHRGERGRQRR